jgi:aerobic-type carbon monoxide dehydrogenase small subunit (CoxS/CutS family)
MRLSVNGLVVEIDADPETTLLDVVRGQLGLTGTKLGCGRGECGACTVLARGRPIMACMTLARLQRDPVITVEGLTKEPEAEALRAAFADHGAFQCGFCTSGQLMHAWAILRAGLPHNAGEARAFIRHRISGNICRCTGYVGIVNAIMSVAGFADAGEAA